MGIMPRTRMPQVAIPIRETGGLYRTWENNGSEHFRGILRQKKTLSHREEAFGLSLRLSVRQFLIFKALRVLCPTKVKSVEKVGLKSHIVEPPVILPDRCSGDLFRYSTSTGSRIYLLVNCFQRILRPMVQSHSSTIS
jgi:hypothetical protein